MENPCEIIEGGVVYKIGRFKEKEVLYDFPLMLEYLQIKGKILFGKDFHLYKKDEKLLFKLCNYIIADKEKCQKFELDPAKGILLTGPVGCGKTSFLKLLRYLVPHQKEYQVIPCRNIAFAFHHLGYKTIEDYGNSSYLCFDDLGVEPEGRFYGKDCNVMGEILLSRYELFLNHKVRTHATTNLNAGELEERYGSRVRSRMRELFNLISFDEKTIDKRK
ncbi:ATPase [Salegentibacter sp. T436]|uniref:ATPase n=1 Tax=Salegentibacter sp. T436 TaxID=1729720 RepID=UPI00094A8A2B|nr:ATPase [Salegentibacter sp. T436]APS40633.1 ATPase [Salegentibacter sp. T436]